MKQLMKKHLINIFLVFAFFFIITSVISSATHFVPNNHLEGFENNINSENENDNSNSNDLKKKKSEHNFTQIPVNINISYNNGVTTESKEPEIKTDNSQPMMFGDETHRYIDYNRLPGQTESSLTGQVFRTVGESGRMYDGYKNQEFIKEYRDKKLELPFGSTDHIKQPEALQKIVNAVEPDENAEQELAFNIFNDDKKDSETILDENLISNQRYSVTELAKLGKLKL